MQIATYATGSAARFGVFQGEHVIDLPGTYGVMEQQAGSQSAQAIDRAIALSNSLAFLQAGEHALRLANRVLAFAREIGALDALLRLGLATPRSKIKFLPPVLRPGKIVCLGHNYKEHIAEMNANIPTHPVLFAKFANTLIGHGATIPIPVVSSKVDYEAELAIVIGKRGKNISAVAAFDHVAGYTVFNDVSVRDFQARTREWLQGKTFDGTGPMGPALVTRDEVPDPHNLSVELRLNGETMQSSNTSKFIFNVPVIIEYISQIMTLEPGDVIATGTPSGVGFRRDPQVFLKPGDSVEVEISGLGILQNSVVASTEGNHG